MWDDALFVTLTKNRFTNNHDHEEKTTRPLSKNSNSTNDNLSNLFFWHIAVDLKQVTFAIKNDFLLWREHCRSRWWRVAHWRLIKSYTTKALGIGSASNPEARPFKNWTSTFYIEGLLNSIFPFCSLLINTVILATLEKLIDLLFFA